MQRDRIFATLKQHQEALRNLGAKSLALFGSVARNEATAGSDVDILVEFESPSTFDR